MKLSWKRSLLGLPNFISERPCGDLINMCYLPLGHGRSWKVKNSYRALENTTVTVGRGREIRTALRTNHIAGLNYPALLEKK